MILLLNFPPPLPLFSIPQIHRKIYVYSPGIPICPKPHRMSMGVSLCPSTESPTLYMGSWDTIGRHLGSLLLYTVLVSHPVQLSSVPLTFLRFILNMNTETMVQRMTSPWKSTCNPGVPSHPTVLRHTVGHLKGSCVSIGKLDGTGHQDWVLSLCCWTSYEAQDRWESYTLHEQSLAILNNLHKVRLLFL